MEMAKRNMPQGPVRAGPPVSSPEDFMRQVQAMQARQPQVPTSGVREATPEEISAKQKQDMAAAIAARSGGEKQAAPAPQGAVTPPAPSVAPSPVPPPPPVGYNGNPDLLVPGQVAGAPIRGDMKRTIQLDKKGQFDYPDSTKSGKGKSKAYGTNLNYYRVLGVEEGDDVGANEAFQKLRKRAKSDPGSITMEEDRLLASSGKNAAVNKSMDPRAVKQRFDARARAASGEEEGASAAPKGDAEKIAQVAIDQAGVPPIKKAPTQEDINKNPGQYKIRNSASVETDTAAVDTENED